MTRTIKVSQAQGRFTASKTGSIQFNNLLYEQVTSRLYLRLINTNNESEYISLCERLYIMNSGEKILNRYLGKFNGQGVGRSRQTNAT